MITAIVLAAGESRRMGSENKLLLPYGNQPLISHVVDHILAANVSTVVVVTGHEHEAVEAVVSDKKVHLTHNPNYREGMSTTIHQGILAAPEDSTGYMICLSDLPRITTADYNRLLASFQGALKEDPQAIVLPVFEQQRGNPVLFSSYYRQAILDNRGLNGCRGIVKQHPDHVIRVDMPNNAILQDIDTRDDYKSLST